MISVFISAVILGLSAGFSPGPLMTLVMTETLRHGIGAGIKVALAPLLTDVPIVLLTLLVLNKLENFQTILGVISLCGGGFLLYLGWQSFRVQALDLVVRETSQSLLKGILTNTLSPHPYLFWISVGGPLMLQALNRNTETAIVFIVGFYSCLIGAKIVLAFLAEKAKPFLSGGCYRTMIRGLGLLLIALAGFLFYDGWILIQGVSLTS